MDRYCWITAQSDRTEHAVSDDAQVVATRGTFEGLCGTQFLAASMDLGPHRDCSGCRTFLCARTATPRTTQRMNRPGWLARICQRRGRHAA